MPLLTVVGLADVFSKTLVVLSENLINQKYIFVSLFTEISICRSKTKDGIASKKMFPLARVKPTPLFQHKDYAVPTTRQQVIMIHMRQY
jgi:hypothetical protein